MLLAVKPTILIASTSRWISPARLALALAQAGCVVDAICPPLNPLMLTHVLREIFIYRGMTPLASFAKAVATCKPDLVIPCDDLSTMHLHELYSHTQPGGKNGDDLRALIERSLGAPAH